MSLTVDFPVIEVGDQTQQFSSWQLEGCTDLITDRGRLYVKSGPDPAVSGDVLVELFRNRERTILVASGSGTTNGFVSLSPGLSSDLEGRVFVTTNGATNNVILWVALASEADLIERDDRLRSMLLEDPEEADFSVVQRATLEDFLSFFHAKFPPASLGLDPLRAFPTLSPVVDPGRFGQPNVTSLVMWTINTENDFELTGLQNPHDYKQWAIHYGRALIWDRRARGPAETDDVAARAQELFKMAQSRFDMAMPWIDLGADGVPDRPAKTNSIRLRRS